MEKEGWQRERQEHLISRDLRKFEAASEKGKNTWA